MYHLCEIDLIFLFKIGERQAISSIGAPMLTILSIGLEESQQPARKL
jgi:hypothetical protein